MGRENGFLDLVGIIHRAAVEPDGWDRVLEGLCGLLGYMGGAVYRQDMVDYPARFLADWGLDPYYLNLYETYYSREATFVQATPRSVGPGSMMLHEDILGDVDLDRTMYFNDFLRPAGWYYSDAVALDLGWPEMEVLVFANPRGWGLPGSESRRMLELLTPHLVTAFRTTKRIQEMEGRIQGLEGMLDVVSTGILMLDERGRVLEANRYAREVMGAGDGLGVDREGRLRGGGGRLARAVQCVTRGEDVPAGGCAVRVERPSGMEPYAVMVGPVEGMVLEKARAMVMVSDPAREPGIGIREIGGMLGLTDAEARVAAGLMAGRSLADVADALGVSMNTVRTHVKRIFEKTRTSRQGQLVAMMLRSGMGMVR